MNTRVFPAVLLAFVLGGAACAQPEAASAPPAASESEASPGTTVMVRNIAFAPPTLTVLRGTEVTWTSADEGVAHTATSGTPGERAIAGVQEGSDPKPDGVFDGELPDAGAEFSFTFDEAGTYAYFCDVHPSMTGEIVVE